MEALVDGFERRQLDSLDELRIAAAGVDRRRRRAGRAAGDRPRSATRSCARSPRSTRSLFAEHQDRYGANLATKVARCLAVTDAEYEVGLEARERLRQRLGELLDRYDLLLTPTVPIAPPPP